MNKLSTYFQLHIILMLYSFSGVCSKKAAGYDFFSLPFILLYGGMIAILIAAEHPELVNKLILGSASAFVGDAHSGIFDEWIALAEEGRKEDD